MLVGSPESADQHREAARTAALFGFVRRHAIDAVLCALVAYAVFRILLPHVNPELPSLRGPVKFWGDEGTVLYHAERIRQGDVLYRDFFDFQGFFGFLPFTVAFSVAPVTPTTGRVTMYLLMAAWGAVTYLTVKEATQKRLAAVLVALYFPLCVFPTWPYAYQHFIAGLWVTAAVLFGIHGDRGGRAWAWSIAGIFSALGFWTSLSEGAVAFVGLFGACLLVGYATRASWARPLMFVAGFASVTALYAIYLASHGALGVAIHDVLVFPFTSYGANNKTEYGFDAPRYVAAWEKVSPWQGRVADHLVAMTLLLPKWGIVVALIVAAVLLDRAFHRRHTRRVQRTGAPWSAFAPCVYVASLGALAVPVWAGYTRSDVSHIGFVQQESVIALTALLAPIRAVNLTKWRWRFVFGLQVVAVVFLAKTVYDAGRFQYANAKAAPAADFDAAVDAESRCALLERRTEPEDRVVTNYAAWVHLACKRKSAISFPHLQQGGYWQEMWPQAAREIAERKPRILLIGSMEFHTLARHEPAIGELYVAAGNSYVLREGRPGPPWGASEWSHTVRGPGGAVVRGRIAFRKNEANGALPWLAFVDDAQVGAPTYVDGARVEIFDGPRTWLLERDPAGRAMTGAIYDGAGVRSVEAELVDAR